ncbi:MAG: DUF2177 family protein [Herminiimonas sp.]|nr:DUF2177 family protein [Herminiimonas sp.]
MNRYLVAYFATAVAFCALDFAWLTVVAPKFYQAQVGPLLLARPNLMPALAFYVIYVVGLVVFCVMPGVSAASWMRAAMLGGLLGLIAYCTYDLSNLATLKGWTTALTVVDMAWGSVASAGASTCGYFGTILFSRLTG